MNRRQFLRLSTGALGSVALAGCSGNSSAPSLVAPTGPEVVAAAARRGEAGAVRSFTLDAAPAHIDLGGVAVDTWAYGGVLPGKEIRVRRGEVIEARVRNGLPAETSVHWHGLALRNDMDGMPGVTQPAIAAGTEFTYRFAADVAGTYWFHPHTGLQLDRGLYAPLIVEDPDDPGTDEDWVIVLDDWLDGVRGATPDSVYAELRGSTGHDMDGMDSTHDMHGMAMGGHASPSPTDVRGGMLMGAESDLLGGDAGDVAYPYFLLNGRTADAPVALATRPRARARIRLINAAADTAFRVALADHRMTVTHTDGYPVTPVDTDALLIGMGERYDVLVTLDDGVFPLVALAEGKGGLARAIVRTADGSTPEASVRPRELDGKLVRYDGLAAATQVRLAPREPDRELALALTGTMGGYDWAINGEPFRGADNALTVKAGERVRIRFTNDSTMWHPMHLHGHTFALSDNGPRKDTVAVLPKQTVVADFDADNPGLWMVHCHNAYHQEAGMMRTLGYLR